MLMRGDMMRWERVTCSCWACCTGEWLCECGEWLCLREEACSSCRGECIGDRSCSAVSPTNTPDISNTPALASLPSLVVGGCGASPWMDCSEEDFTSTTSLDLSFEEGSWEAESPIGEWVSGMGDSFFSTECGWSRRGSEDASERCSEARCGMELGCALTSDETPSLSESERTDRCDTSDLLRLSFIIPGAGRTGGGWVPLHTPTCVMWPCLSFPISTLLLSESLCES